MSSRVPGTPNVARREQPRPRLSAPRSMTRPAMAHFGPRSWPDIAVLRWVLFSLREDASTSKAQEGRPSDAFTFSGCVGHHHRSLRRCRIACAARRSANLHHKCRLSARVPVLGRRPIGRWGAGGDVRISALSEQLRLRGGSSLLERHGVPYPAGCRVQRGGERMRSTVGRPVHRRLGLRPRLHMPDCGWERMHPMRREQGERRSRLVPNEHERSLPRHPDATRNGGRSLAGAAPPLRCGKHLP